MGIAEAAAAKHGDGAHMELFVDMTSSISAESNTSSEGTLVTKGSSGSEQAAQYISVASIMVAVQDRR